MSHHTETLVVGAGPAGLTAAYLLSKHGRSVTVLERDPAQVGGISRTVSHNGYLFDIGGHRFFSKSKAVVDLWDEILPDDFIERPRLSRIYYQGKYYAYPLKAFEALRNLGLLTSTACVLSYLYARAKPIETPRSFHDWVRNQFGERLFSIFFKTYTEKVWGMSCDAISADWAAQRIKGLDLGAAIRDALMRSLGLRGKPKAGGKAGGKTDEPVIKTLIESFRYPRRGPGMMWEAAAAKIQAQGGRVLLDRGVDGLSYDPATGIWTVSVLMGDGSRETYTARNLVSSAPVRELVDAIRPRPLSTFHARALQYRDFLTVALIAKSDKTFPDNWIYIHDPSVKVGRVQNFLSWSPEMVPDEGHTCLGLEYFCFEGDGLWNSSDADLVALAKAEIGKIGLIDPADVVDACVVRQPKAYPVYDETYASNVAMVRMELERDFPTLHLVGRNGMHKYNNQDHAMMTAMLTVENILAGQRRHDVWRVNEDAEYTEAGISGAEAALGSERLVPRKVA
ncbi:NAD(P)/FAD-dependent oxidoreductase [Methylobacterium gregans]|uniref:Thiamine thiazole synthase n=1 Tax=Methylobacterium gregans TaxID=374424 RepID=A0AA37HJX9_9HYPH|nr:NAD(P)/FAD-dependent oxidoreductase [Methylobacterium gregans]MDQ0519800.1 protoporphyrinogen oxidase [Methylobacterium gregans]GJD76958.1 Thiamine thiazole synthase [Methylobacterium gregans]GLS54078.1 protoporphyrinogen oxidase [Methylobacterium gregans]